MLALPSLWMHLLARTAFLGLLVGSIGWSSIVRADGPAISEEARGHFKAGVALLQDPEGERVEQAYREFRAAYALSNSPKILGNMGLCAMKLERDGEAIDAYTRYLREVPDVDPDERAQIVRDLQTLSISVVRVQLTVNAKSFVVTDVRVPVKGERVTNVYPMASSPAALGIRPGHHVITLRAPGFQDSVWEFEAFSGTKESHAVTLKADEPRPAPRVGGDEPRPAPRSVAPWVVAGVGGALLAAGAITGIVALGKTSSISDTCPKDVCPSSFDLEGARSSARTFVSLTDGLLIGGGALVLGGLTWGLLSGGKGGADAPKVAAACSPQGCLTTARVSF